ncbi:DNA binding protein [Dorcoceras hygrometricum]|uniref:DNA binding protein n=1 Tax=Dorcoceras hygrometricum TaxID=472368 RepID=A0A2Z7CT91_9LAMI|nr:DNA binding protein [Dorcoceras hygrometricum]
MNSSLRLDCLLYDVASSCDWMYKLPAESLAQEQNAVVSTYVNDIVLLSLSPNSICCSLRLDCLLYDVASSCDWMYKLPADSYDCSLKPSAEYDDVTDDVINANPSADLSARRRFNSFAFLHLLIANC